MKIGLVWFGDDLRCADQKILWRAAQEVDQLVCLYCDEPNLHRANRYGLQGMSSQRQRFLKEGLDELARGLIGLGQVLYISHHTADSTIALLLDSLPISHVYRNQHPGHNEQQILTRLENRYTDVAFHKEDGMTLLSAAQLPFPLEQLPASFSKFRRLVEELPTEAPLPELDELPPAPSFTLTGIEPWLIRARSDHRTFNGGELAALNQLSDYFATDLASHYKHTRNELDGWENTTKFSPWLAQGSLSARQIRACLDVYERDHGANESTYWIFFELLWREYFHWYATLHGKHLFKQNGPFNRSFQGSFYPERFKKWCQGNTPYALVNACMKQLKETGFMSNRGRQIVASCLIYELGVDWRYGAAYFEQQLIDYDVGSNWGNWQYIAGVGADPRGGRHFNIEKQTEMYDPKHHFIEKWCGHNFDAQLDSVDAADWPISPSQ